MRSWFLIVTMLAGSLGRQQSQGRADFSGSWVVADPWERVDPSSQGLALGPAFTLTQDATTLSVEMAGAYFGLDPTSPGGHEWLGVGSLRRDTYNLEGESRVTYPQPSGSLTPGPPSRPLASLSRATWQGNVLVVVTHTTMVEHFPARRPSDFTLEKTRRLVFHFDDKAQLVVESLIIEDPLPWSSLLYVAARGPVTTAYKRGS
jgi:hypothetical protein